MNLVVLRGNVGAEPETKSGENWQRASFSLATSRRVKEGETWVEKTTWHRCIAWGRLAKIVGDHVRKGTPLVLRGRIDNRKVEKDGQTRYFSDVVVDELEFAAPKGSGGERPAPKPAAKPKPVDDWGVNDDDDIPF